MRFQQANPFAQSHSNAPVDDLGTLFHHQQQHGIAGRQLNHIDTEWTAGIEHYMPTPAIRLRVVKNRLQWEVSVLSDRLAKYQRIPSPTRDILEKIDSLKQRLKTLQEHQYRIDSQLAALFHDQNAFFELSNQAFSMSELTQKFVSQTLGWLLPGRWVEKSLEAADPKRARRKQLSHQLQTVTDILSDPLSAKTATANEVSFFVNRYDRTLKELESLTPATKTTLSIFKNWV